MKPFILCLILSALSCPAARVETFTLDLERPQQPFTLSITEATDATVTATLKASGSEFDPAGWTCLLWYGTTAGGITLTNSASSYGAVTWSVPAASVPTNGRYSVQVFGMITNVTEEWGRGAMTVRLNPARDYMPALWSTNSASAIASAAQRSADFVLALVETNTVSPSQLVSATGGLASASSVASVSGAVAVIQSALPGLATTQGIAAAIAGIPAEQDLAALRSYHYGSSDIVESPTNWFTVDASGTITDYSFESGRENVVIPWRIGGVSVTGIGTAAFSGQPGDAITNVIAPKTLTYVGFNAFATCPDLVSVIMPSVIVVDYGAFYYCLSATTISVPSATSIGEFSFASCSALQSLSFTGNAPSVGAAAFEGAHPSLTVTATNPQATGWGGTLSDGTREVPVVRPALRADAVYQSGQRVATTNDVEVARAEAEDNTERLAGIVNTNYYTKAEATALVAPLAPTNAPVLLNPSVLGAISLLNAAPTNLVLELYATNNMLMVREVHK